MRLRFTVLATAVAALALAAVPGVASAAPRHNRGLTIHAVPHSIIAGEAVLIFGQLQGPDTPTRRSGSITAINPNRCFSLIGDDPHRLDRAVRVHPGRGLVLTNRSWFVRGPGFTHSRTVHERVAALVSLAASSPSGLTRHPIIFSGHVTPDHSGERVSASGPEGLQQRLAHAQSRRRRPGLQLPVLVRVAHVPGAR